jgi:hypothetical protein
LRKKSRSNLLESTMPSPNRQPGPWWQRLAWFIAIWCMSVAALGAVAWVLKHVAV